MQVQVWSTSCVTKEPLFAIGALIMLCLENVFSFCLIPLLHVARSPLSHERPHAEILRHHICHQSLLWGVGYTSSTVLAVEHADHFIGLSCLTSCEVKSTQCRLCVCCISLLEVLLFPFSVCVGLAQVISGVSFLACRYPTTASLLEVS